MDFETYSEAGYQWDALTNKWVSPPGASQGKKGLEVVGAAVYAKHPSTEVLSFFYDLKKGEGRRFWKPGMPDPVELFVHLVKGGLVEAHNSGFEWWIWNEVCVSKYGWPPLKIESLRCSAAKARAFAMPGKLALLSDVLDLSMKKDSDGDRLLKRFSMPRNPTKTDARLRIRPEDDPVDGPKLYSYNERDIVSEAEASSRLPELTPEELQHWLIDQRINRRGIQIDLPAVRDCISIVGQARSKYGKKFEELVGCKYSEVQQFRGWLKALGVSTDSLDDDATAALLKSDIPPGARAALKLRSRLSLASVSKLFAMQLQTDAGGRLYDLYTFHGARTGRPTGGGVQPTNLAKAGPDVYHCDHCGRWHGHHTVVCPWCLKLRKPGPPEEWNPDATEDAFRVVKGGSLELLESVFGPHPLLTISGMLRGMFVAKLGHDFVSSDFSAIEGVVIAAIAGEKWRLEVFGGHGKIYEMSAAKILGIPFEEMMEYRRIHNRHHPGRQSPGKVAELGLGFGGWINAWKQFNGPGTDDEIKANILAWREASPAIVYLWGGQTLRWDLYRQRELTRTGVEPTAAGWTDRERKWGKSALYGLEGAVIEAMTSKATTWVDVARLDGASVGVSYRFEGGTLYCRLPSGRNITYHRAELKDSGDWRGLAFTYWGYNTNPKNGPVGWIQMSCYAGRFAENVVQAIARDIQMHAIANCERSGYPVVMHTYDEVVAEVPSGFGSVEELEALMAYLPKWAKGWPIKAAGGWRRKRYCKA